MQEIEPDQLAAVIGAGESTTDVGIGPLHVRHSTSDYQTCVNAMRDSAQREYPSNGFWIFKRDSNAAPRARAEADDIGRYCGPPPKN